MLAKTRNFLILKFILYSLKIFIQVLGILNNIGSGIQVSHNLFFFRFLLNYNNETRKLKDESKKISLKKGQS